MDWPYIHTLINHFPIILTVVGSGALLLALVTRKRGHWLYALATLTLAALTVYPAAFSGDQASDALRDTWYVVHDMVRAHDASATWALLTVIPMGLVAAYTGWRMLDREPDRLPPVWLRTLLAALTALGLAVIVRTAYLGGLIIHESPRLKAPPPGMTPPADTSGRPRG